MCDPSDLDAPSRAGVPAPPTVHSLTVRLRSRPGHLEALLAALGEQSRRSVAEEPGCLQFDVAQDVEDDHQLWLYELYADEAALAAHRDTDHFWTWRQAAEQHAVAGSQVNVVGRRVWSGQPDA